MIAGCRFPTAPTYTCTITSGAHSVNRRARIPIKLRDTGPSTVGSTDTVTLSSPGTALGGPFPAGTSTVGFSGALPVMGAQTDSVPLTGTMMDSGNGVFSMSGRLMLNAAGLDHILPPPRFTVTIHAAGVISVVVTCVLVTTMTATMPSSVAVQVTRAAGTAIVPFMAGATPSGAPNTGGGGSLHHASDLTGLAVGGAVVLAGLGIMLAGMRRLAGAVPRLYRAGPPRRKPGHCAGPAPPGPDQTGGESPHGLLPPLPAVPGPLVHPHLLRGRT